MKIHKIRLKNFHGFVDQDFVFGSRFNLIVGDNGKGKTSLLDGLAVGLGSLFLGFSEPAHPRNIMPLDVRRVDYVLGNTPTLEPQYPVEIQVEGEVDGEQGAWCRELWARNGRTSRQNAEWIRDRASRFQEAVQNGQPVNLPLVSYYGTERLWIQLRQTRSKKEVMDTLKPDTRFMGYLDCLNPASDVKRLQRWFKTLELAALQHKKPNPTLEAARLAILACVPDAQNVYHDVQLDEMIICFERQRLPFSLLSDGYRNMVALVADIAVRCATVNPHLGAEASRNTPGVVLIDELDLHLHPLWQRRVIGDLLHTFPGIQFFGTTHSPFVIQSLPPLDGVQLLNLDEPKANEYLNKSVEDISEQIQGVNLPQHSKRFLDMMKAAEEYYAVLNQAQGVGPSEREKLKRRLDELTMPFSDDPAYQAFLKCERVAAGMNGKAD